MIGSLVRWFGPAAATKYSPRGAGSTLRFAPWLEALEDRMVPGGAAGGIAEGVSNAALLGANHSGSHHETVLGSTPSIIVGSTAVSAGSQLPPSAPSPAIAAARL